MARRALLGLALCLRGAPRVAAAGCPSSAPPAWPVRFKILQRKVPADDADCGRGTCSNVTAYYDWGRQANLIIVRCPANSTLWDLELGSGHSYYIHPGLRQCMFHEFDVGILRRSWLEGATFLGESFLNGRLCQVWTKDDFIDYYADAEDCTPVSWFFHTMRAWFHTIDYLEGEAVPDDNFFSPPEYCPNRTAGLDGLHHESPALVV
ncbi:unnamed protein product [Prorocentrum cordatum]|uniref:Uncharacterized protein n=1 Tax=Prorocentrum cordatum TaxID=2364126 RepID=A0ABN9W3I6_9DINO|nr:unnamed protein product [Polarella glacialis]